MEKSFAFSYQLLKTKKNNHKILLMKKLIFFVIYFFIIHQAFSQSEISPKIISNIGGESNDQRLSWTLGEMMILTIPNDNSESVITQGFHQPFLQDEQLSTQVFSLLNEEWEVNIYPNPFSKEIFIEKKIANSLRYEIFDLLGRKVNEGQLDNELASINLSQLLDEIYLITFYTKKNQWIATFKISKINN